MSDIVAGLATYLSANGIGVWRADGAYQAGELAIIDTLVPSTPDNVIVLTEYPVDDDGSLANSTVGVQVRVRRAGSDPRPTKQTSKSIFELIHGAENLLLDGIPVALIVRRSAANLGPDQNGRFERSENYYLDCTIPTAHREF